jgi:hypothetical protein
MRKIRRILTEFPRRTNGGRNRINVKLAQRDLVPLLAGLSGFAANPGGDTPCGRALPHPKLLPEGEQG